MVIDPVAQRMTDLAEAFRAFRSSVPGLTVEVVGHMNVDGDLVHPVAGFHVRMPDADGAGGIQLYVSANYGELIRWGDAGAVRERFNVQLESGYCWGETEFPDAASLAHDVIAYMQFNLDVLASR